MLTLTNNGNCITTGSSWYTRANYWKTIWALDVVGIPLPVYLMDPIAEDIKLLEFRNPVPLDIVENMGYESVVQPRTSTILGFPQTPYDLPSKLDKLTGIANLNRFLSQDTGDLVPSNEHTTAHVNIVGSVTIGAQTSPRRGGPTGDAFVSVSLTNDHHSYIGYNRLSQVGVPVFSEESTLEILLMMKARVDDHYYRDGNVPFGDYNGSRIYLGGRLYTCEVTDLAWNIVDGCLISFRHTLTERLYHWRAEYQSYILSNIKELRIGHGVYWVTGDTAPTLSTHIFTRVIPHHTTTIVCRAHRSMSNDFEPLPWVYDGTPVGPNPNDWDPDTSSTWNDFYAWSCSESPAYGWESYSGISGDLGYRKVDVGDTSFLRFRRDVVSYSNDLLALGFLAQSNAWDTNNQVIKGSAFEFLTELSSICDLLSNPWELWQTASRLGKGEGMITTLRSFLDICADAQLYYSFMLKPTAELAAEFSSKAAQLREVLSVFSAWDTWNGKYTYHTGNEIPVLSDSIIVARSKMRVRVPPDSVLAAVLPLDRVGILPDLSRFWETLSRSFLVDWFFNVKAKLEVIDKTVRFMALDCGYCVNSITVYKAIEPADFLVGEDTSYKYYTRYVVPAPQIFLPTRLNVLGASGIPDLRVAGSLFYKRVG